ncbi:hypothetical protein HCBG_06260 [Histoplasma capsulatum G186AR]|uniref:Uncharacterized protein n=1 Tax=Ajellomyces capsulatus (strain G186AR / H82 / ATCC MYA-2454 / RMSCC 2432) TaxID=447093 RepID=C0NSY0_AJECG|nr:uncharacterized protein HCBG_06260 [Histoplasma capsulatum G186AR]EEH05141.1 hypothetical protein HCBG_06260 [Histoplasma capsulatum G186AR]
MGSMEMKCKRSVALDKCGLNINPREGYLYLRAGSSVASIMAEKFNIIFVRTRK